MSAIFPEAANDVGLATVVHGQVGLLPVPQHAHALKLAALPLHLPVGVFPAFAAELTGAHLVAGLADLFFHVEFNRQAMAVPARHIGGIVSAQGPRLDDNVLENLVHGVADVQGAIGIGGAIVEHEFGLAGAGGTNLPVQILLLPLLQAQRFPLYQPRFHRKRGVGEVQGILVITHDPKYSRPSAISFCSCRRSNSRLAKRCSSRTFSRKVTLMLRPYRSALKSSMCTSRMARMLSFTVGRVPTLATPCSARSAAPLHFHQVDPGQGSAQPMQFQVGGGETQFVTAPVAVYHFALYLVGTPQQFFREGEIRVRKCPANAGAADPGAGPGQRIDEFGPVSVALALLLHQQKVPPPAMAETKVVPHHDMAHSQALDEYPGNEIVCAHGLQPGVKPHP